MKYGNVYVLLGVNHFIPKIDSDGNEKFCSGFDCEVYSDETYENHIETFTIAYDYEIADDSEEAIDEAIRKHLNLDSEESIEVQEKKTADLITTEDLAEQALYAATAPEDATPSERARAMLGMLGANIMDPPISENESEEESVYKIPFTDASGKEYELIPDVVLHDVEDFMGEPQYNLGLRFLCEHNGRLATYCNFTLNMGEFIGLKNAAYVDMDESFLVGYKLQELGLAEDTGLTKRDGYFDYPLWKFSDEFLESLNSEVYKIYSDKYDEYMEQAFGDSIQDMNL